MSRYVVITPVHNEEALIGKTIASMGQQLDLPLRWVIVDDASTDGTAQVVRNFQQQYRFIELVNVDRPRGRNFGSKARAFNRGYNAIRNLQFDYIGNLDGDISFAPDYFRALLTRLDQDAQLGIAGGMVLSNVAGKFVSQNVALDSVAGAVQMFRRDCLEQLGGYLELRYGGIDSAAEITARMKGWKVQTFPELQVFEHRRTGTANAGPIRARIREGQRQYALGYGFLFYLLRCFYRSLESPVLIGSAAALFGYLKSRLAHEPLVLSPEVVRYLRDEQRRKISQLLRRSVPAQDSGKPELRSSSVDAH
jgi:glycosyltransferase involved in cell wall biosynthesis